MMLDGRDGDRDGDMGRRSKSLERLPYFCLHSGLSKTGWITTGGTRRTLLGLTCVLSEAMFSGL